MYLKHKTGLVICQDGGVFYHCSDIEVFTIYGCQFASETAWHLHELHRVVELIKPRQEKGIIKLSSKPFQATRING